MTLSAKDAIGAAVRRSIEGRFNELGSCIDTQVRPSQFADFQSNAALGLAQVLGAQPREIARTVASDIRESDAISEAVVSGPGYINITVDDRWLEKSTNSMCERPARSEESSGQTVVIDYSSPNVAKTMHVGHLRTTVVGDAIARVRERLGDRVIRQNHIGDWGTPFGMLIAHVEDSERGGFEQSLRQEDLTELYRTARRRFDDDESFASRSRSRVVALQRGEPDAIVVWRRLVASSTQYFQAEYDRLGVTLTTEHIAGESSYRAELQHVCDELVSQGLARQSRGALCVFPHGFISRDGEPQPLIIRKGDGGFGYATTDLAAIRRRVRDLGASDLLYVVGAPQYTHFAMVFETAREAGWLPQGVTATHVQIGNVLGDDGKILRTRSGDTPSLSHVVDRSIASARELIARNDGNASDAVREHSARALGVGALKFADLMCHHDAEYTFDLDRMLQVQGRTGPYVQYAATRVKSLLRKAKESGFDEPGGSIRIVAPEERALALVLLDYESVLRNVRAESAPHVLAEHLVRLAQCLSAFYDRHPILKEPDAPLRESRLRMCQVVLRQLREGLSLLGIDVPELM